ncbi:unnamed protein product [Protopolystoma xenopodis]|uniref:Uncharacterized protein n=1 Tax=Protopolystoma xenopodis TaxID=117903 RepID=A0A3S5FFQ0_9PLAT|nr:unnamed protein product [Protopolystoma xenopodis]
MHQWNHVSGYLLCCGPSLPSSFSCQDAGQLPSASCIRHQLCLFSKMGCFRSDILLVCQTDIESVRLPATVESAEESFCHLKDLASVAKEQLSKGWTGLSKGLQISPDSTDLCPNTLVPSRLSAAARNVGMPDSIEQLGDWKPLLRKLPHSPVPDLQFARVIHDPYLRALPRSALLMDTYSSNSHFNKGPFIRIMLLYKRTAVQVHNTSNQTAQVSSMISQHSRLTNSTKIHRLLFTRQTHRAGTQAQMKPTQSAKRRTSDKRVENERVAEEAEEDQERVNERDENPEGPGVDQSWPIILPEKITCKVPYFPFCCLIRSVVTTPFNARRQIHTNQCRSS